MSSTVLFFVREINCFLETLSSFCIFEKALFLDPRDSILERFEHRGSILEVRVSSVNLLLSGTVLKAKKEISEIYGRLLFFLFTAFAFLLLCLVSFVNGSSYNAREISLLLRLSITCTL